MPLLEAQTILEARQSCKLYVQPYPLHEENTIGAFVASVCLEGRVTLLIQSQVRCPWATNCCAHLQRRLTAIGRDLFSSWPSSTQGTGKEATGATGLC